MRRLDSNNRFRARRGIGVRGALCVAALISSLLLALPAASENLPPPSGEVLLVVKGAIARTNVGAEAHFDRRLFDSLGMVKITTRTAWHLEDTVFEGVPARRLMEAVGAAGVTVTAVAANDYRIKIPLTDFSAYDVMLATRIDGEALRLRTRGPIWVIYPEGADLPAPLRRERMIWQLIELRIE